MLQGHLQTRFSLRRTTGDAPKVQILYPQFLGELDEFGDYFLGVGPGVHLG